MAVKKSNEKITVEAMCTVIWQEKGEYVNQPVRTFDKAWHKALEMAPSELVFVGFVRKEEK
jgi:hypothetical protein